MGYELNIQREDEIRKITLQEWKKYIYSDPEFESIENYSATLGNGNILTVPTPNAGLWKSERTDVPFTFSVEFGWISVKNPENWIIEKMIEVAKNLDATVKGEEREIYDENYLKDISLNPSENDSFNTKKWWEFWK